MKKICILFSILMMALSHTASAQENCGKFNHARAYFVDEDGTPHWRMYTFADDCKEVKVEFWHGKNKLEKTYTDKIDDQFYCLDQSGEVCLYGYSWSYADGVIISKTESIRKGLRGNRLIKNSIDRTLSIKPDGFLGELLVSDIYYKDDNEEGWFNASTSRHRCELTTSPKCRWMSEVRR